MPGVALYARISDDSAGTRLGVKRQIQDCRQLAELRGWEIGGEYVDNDISAYAARVVRPEFETARF